MLADLAAKPGSGSRPPYRRNNWSNQTIGSRCLTRCRVSCGRSARQQENCVNPSSTSTEGFQGYRVVVYTAKLTTYEELACVGDEAYKDGYKPKHASACHHCLG